MKRQIKIKDHLEVIYKQHPELFKLVNIKRLIWTYWYSIDKVVGNDKGDLDFKGFEKATSPESITRSRRELLESKGIKDPVSVELEKDYRDHYCK